MSTLTDAERATYEWQLGIPDFGEAGQAKLRNATALISRCGGLGGPLAYNLAGAGIGRLIVAHGGDLQASDLNRQVLMTHDWIGKPRVESAARRLKELNPRLDIECVPENISEANASDLVAKADIVFDCAPLFSERFAMNKECVRQRKPMVDCAVFSMEGQVMTVLPGRTACLSCLYPEAPPGWKRQFPIFGAVSATAAAIGAMEGIKLVSGMGVSLAGMLLYFDLGSMAFRKIPVERRADCPICGGVDDV